VGGGIIEDINRYNVKKKISLYGKNEKRPTIPPLVSTNDGTE